MTYPSRSIFIYRWISFELIEGYTQSFDDLSFDTKHYTTIICLAKPTRSTK
ncbi:hypothetical protein Hanom_Chr01g00094271 [Helianthus anomalus]